MACPSSRKPVTHGPTHFLRASLWRRLVPSVALLLSVALAGCGSGAGATTIRSVPAPTWASAAGAPGVSTATTPGWSQYRDATYGFVAQFPTNATINAAPAQGTTRLTSWRFVNPQDAADTATLEVTATTQANTGLCSQYTSGKPVTVAGGVTGYQQDNLSASSSSTTAQPQVAVVIVHGGLLTIITLTGQSPASTFMQRWGAVWSHILATFQPGVGPIGAQPCA